MTLFTSGCARCGDVEEALDSAGLVYGKVDVRKPDGPGLLAEALGGSGVYMEDLPMPVLSHGSLLWFGDDCLVAIEEGELQG